jgi:hypothetical protein
MMFCPDRTEVMWMIVPIFPMRGMMYQVRWSMTMLNKQQMQDWRRPYLVIRLLTIETRMYKTNQMHNVLTIL